MNFEPQIPEWGFEIFKNHKDKIRAVLHGNQGQSNLKEDKQKMYMITLIFFLN